MSETLLKIEGANFPSLSARGCEQVLNEVCSGDFRRTISGKLIFTGIHQEKKYHSIISCKDILPPALERLKRGDSVKVWCLQNLSQLIDLKEGDTQLLLNRQAVPESIDIRQTATGITIPVKKHLGVEVTIDPCTQTQQVVVSYRPILEMKVQSISYKTQEWDLTTEWCIKLEEC